MNLKLIKKILGIYQKLVLLILIIYFGSNQKYWNIDEMKTQKEPKEKENKTRDNLKCSLNLFFIK